MNEIEEKRNILIEILRKHRVKRASLFGSVVMRSNRRTFIALPLEILSRSEYVEDQNCTGKK